MNRMLAGVVLVFMVFSAHADERNPVHEIKFHFTEGRSWSSLLGDSAGEIPPPYMAPANAHGRESGYLLLDTHRQQNWEMRDQLFESLGAARLIPQGSFLAGGITTRWHLSAPNEETLELKFSARF